MIYVFLSASKRVLASSLLLCLLACGESDSGGSVDSQGVSGSKAQLIKFEGAIYSLASNKLIRVDVSTPSQPKITDDILLDFNAETITTDEDAIFIGSPGEVRTYQFINDQLEFVDSSVRVIPGKDPVITDGDYAYSTVITSDWSYTDEHGDLILGGRGDLYVYDVDSANNITELAFYPNIGYVQGLALWGKNLLVCDPVDGLMQLDVTDPLLVEIKKQFSFVLCEDILHLGGGHFATVGEDGIYQFVPYNGNKLAVMSLVE